MAKFTVMFKMPDAGSDAIRDAVSDGILNPKDEKKARAICAKLFDADEYVYIVVDTDTGAATVRPSGR